MTDDKRVTVTMTIWFSLDNGDSEAFSFPIEAGWQTPVSDLQGMVIEALSTPEALATSSRFGSALIKEVLRRLQEASSDS